MSQFYLPRALAAKPTPSSASGLLLTVCALVAVELFGVTRTFRQLDPVPIFLLLIVYTAMSAGLRAGLLSAFLMVLASFRYLATPGTFFEYGDDELQRLISNIVVMPVTALLVGMLKLRADRLAAGELRASEDRFEATFEQAAVGIAHVALDGRLLRANQRLCDMLGYPREELLGRRLQEFAHPDDLDSAGGQLRDLLDNTMQTFTHEQRYVRRDGRIVWASLTVSVVRWPEGAPDYCITVLTDITGQKLVEHALRESEERYRSLFAHNPEAMWVYDRATLRFLEVNDTAVTRYGYSRAEFSAMTLRDIRPAEDIHLLEERLQERVDGTSLSGTWRHRKRDGTIIWVDIVSHPIMFDGHAAVLVLVTDITQRRQAELALAAEKERLAVTLRSIGDGVITTDTQGRVVLLNPAAEALTGWSQVEAKGVPINRVFSLLDETTGRRLDNPVSRVLESGQTVARARPLLLVSQHGTTRLITDSAAPIRDHDGRIIGSVLVFRDITDRARLEQQLQQAQRMESIGLLASGIAHDFNNLLTGIIGIADLALLDVPEEHPLWEDLHNIRKQGHRGAALTKQLLAFSRRQILEPKFVNLNDTIREVESFIRRALGAHIQLVFEPDPALATVYVDPVQLEQVLLNLCINARDAMPQGGRLALSTANVTLDETFCQTHVDACPGDYVQLVISDTGQGMDQETVQRIFEPFFTTKGPGKGTGLGLAMVYGIITQHHGLIYVDSQPGQGSSFTILLPVAEAVPEITDRLLGLRPRRGNETILVAEDEDVVRELMVRVLTAHGYNVLAAADGADALRVFEAHAAAINLVVLNLVMPKLGGHAVYEALRQQAPNTKVLFVTGHTASALQEQFIMEPGLELLLKPFEPLELVQRVRSILDTGVAAQVSAVAERGALPGS